MDVHATVIKYNIKDLTHSVLIFLFFFTVSLCFFLNILTSDKDEKLILRDMQHRQNPPAPPPF